MPCPSGSVADAPSITQGIAEAAAMGDALGFGDGVERVGGAVGLAEAGKVVHVQHCDRILGAEPKHLVARLHLLGAGIIGYLSHSVHRWLSILQHLGSQWNVQQLPTTMPALGGQRFRAN